MTWTILLFPNPPHFHNSCHFPRRKFTGRFFSCLGFAAFRKADVDYLKFVVPDLKGINLLFDLQCLSFIKSVTGNILPRNWLQKVATPHYSEGPSAALSKREFLSRFRTHSLALSTTPQILSVLQSGHTQHPATQQSLKVIPVLRSLALNLSTLPYTPTHP